ncbi:coproporphyrinogen III oxidase [Clostridia bacterium]|nr:coproporphyrinogen III oxidase [Clostridia bacterium]
MIIISTVALYIHIPFCAKKCGYCDFYSLAGSDALKEAYASALIRQIEEYAIPARGITVESVYIGGGTPSEIGIPRLHEIIKRVKKLYTLANNAEFTVEVNPGAIDPAGLKKLYKDGVNRLSVGIQSAHESELRYLGRRHTFSDAVRCIEDAKTTGFKNISVDLMYAVPGQSADSFIESVKRVLELEPAHISLYGLKIEPGTLFHKNLDKIVPYLPNEETERTMYMYGSQILAEAGLRKYEISNFAKPGAECRHNLRYWHCGEYIGLGAAAHSYFGGTRYSFAKNVKHYISHLNTNAEALEKVDIFDKERYSLFDEYTEISPSERIGEFVMLGFRLVGGIDVNQFAQRFRRDFDDMYLDKMRPFLASGHIVKTVSGYALTDDGMMISNYILSRIIDFDG